VAEVFEDIGQEEVSEIEAVAQQQVEQQQAAQQPEEDVPEEFKGMSPAEIARIAKHARREMGRQANELGEIRKLADELIKSQLQKPKEADTPKEVDFFENPQEAIRRAVESNPKVQQAEQYAIQAQRAMARQQLQQMHPDMGEIIADQGFQQWVSGSPVRKNLLQQADQGFDLNAAHELLSTYKELRAVKRQQQESQVVAAENTARKQALNAAAVDTGGSGETTRKVYRRADLIRLKMTDPSRYEAMNDEILQAYAEGRVR
jgi:hypothetical protein